MPGKLSVAYVIVDVNWSISPAEETAMWLTLSFIKELIVFLRAIKICSLPKDALVGKLLISLTIL